MGLDPSSLCADLPLMGPDYHMCEATRRGCQKPIYEGSISSMINSGLLTFRLQKALPHLDMPLLVVQVLFDDTARIPFPFHIF